ncbi:tetratricopeptide repeat domain 19 [Haematobia irritans]|uniref:tetratricopeptide repeat domain 19 n=1 Tax=Haematobia irritans TaxID=7368 RepID=UPI003F4F6890
MRWFLQRCLIRNLRFLNNTRQLCTKVQPKRPHNSCSNYVVVPLSLSLFGFSAKEEETPEDKLITTIKRAVLSINGGKFDKAEQMLHLALRMAQDLQSRDGITYVYDVMGNLALEREQYKKAEKLFTEVMKRLMQDGYAEDNPKILHISLKLANIAQFLDDVNKAMLGFTWTIQKVEECLRKSPEDMDLKELLGLAHYWFGQLHMKINSFEDAKKYLKNAYECFIKIHGTDNEECITILNNLSVACVKLEQLGEAISYIEEALKIVKKTEDGQQEGVLQSNLGLIYLQQGLVDEAKKLCTQAWRLGQSKKDESTIQQAEYCLNEIKLHFSKQ